jgi:hypothetical protein
MPATIPFPGPASLLTPEQPSLWDDGKLPLGWELVTVHERKDRGTSDGSRILDERRAKIVEDLGAGLSMRKIAQRHNVDPHTVAAIRKQEKLPVHTQNQRVADELMLAAEIGAELMRETFQAGKVPAPGLGINLGIAIERAQTLKGEPSSIVENRSLVVVRSFDDFVNDLRLAPTQSGAGNPVAKELPATGSTAPLEAVREGQIIEVTPVGDEPAESETD